MAKPTSTRRLPSLTVLMGIGLAAYYLAVFRPLSREVALLDRPLVATWNSFVATNANCAACAGLDLQNFEQRLESVRQSAANLQVADRMVRARLELMAEVRARLQEPFQLIDYQNERQVQADQLMRLAKAEGVKLEPAATNGLPEYSADLVDPRFLWVRLHLATQLLRAAVHTKTASIQSLTQLPTVSRRVREAGGAGFDEMPMRLEVEGDMGPMSRFVASLPLRDAELKAVGLADVLTNKPVLFIDQVLARKSAPEHPGRLRLELTVSGWVPVRGEGGGWTPR